MKSYRVNGWVLALGAVIMISGWGLYIIDRDPGINGAAFKNEFWFRTVVVSHEDGQIAATPDPLRANPEDRIRWENPSGKDFRIEFENQEYPFTESKFSSEEAKTYKKLREGTPMRDYKYAVILGSDTLDPVIRIEQDPPPGGDSSGVVKK
ncbi:MAG: hypothetical protein KJ970_11645 [Candidatus Eisenbacteria bacterium]|uniref:Uncharacterized protein n=1 Tax=Eiseniibacteriota bacterium TaxID=2212470 RepID=A0A948W7F3_UNCEI|nr:hypothetical protein [Candidatus Eisenbacteria bacterium]MBU1949742.1 hypothetical protein [Candidatus Eisenbacteria bacterium]MBU2691571.1 hypothetical protein [Candidatus Eisenbacteria bacterium]